MSKEKNNVENVIESASESLENLIDVNKIVGEKITNERGQTVIPISKLTIGILGGGGEYGQLKISEKLGERFAGGSFIISSIKPECFVIDNGNGFEVVDDNSALDSLFLAIKRVLEKLK